MALCGKKERACVRGECADVHMQQFSKNRAGEYCILKMIRCELHFVRTKQFDRKVS